MCLAELMTHQLQKASMFEIVLVRCIIAETVWPLDGATAVSAGKLTKYFIQNNHLYTTRSMKLANVTY